MASRIFVNLPVKDLPKSIEFFTRLGYKFNLQFTDETATCMIVRDDIFVMLLTHDKFESFTVPSVPRTIERCPRNDLWCCHPECSEGPASAVSANSHPR